MKLKILKTGLLLSFSLFSLTSIAQSPSTTQPMDEETKKAAIAQLQKEQKQAEEMFTKMQEAMNAEIKAHPNKDFSKYMMDYEIQVSIDGLSDMQKHLGTSVMTPELDKILLNYDQQALGKDVTRADYITGYINLIENKVCKNQECNLPMLSAVKIRGVQVDKDTFDEAAQLKLSKTFCDKSLSDEKTVIDYFNTPELRANIQKKLKEARTNPQAPHAIPKQSLVETDIYKQYKEAVKKLTNQEVLYLPVVFYLDDQKHKFTTFDCKTQELEKHWSFYDKLSGDINNQIQWKVNTVTATFMGLN